jgi:CO dehydrogenase maturation factor
VPSLAGALFFPEPDKIIPLSEMSELIEERTGAKPGTIGQLFSLNPKVDDLPDKIAHQHNGIKLLVMGGVKTAGRGCACPESALIKSLIRHLLLERNERVIIDMEAGIEHLGRSTADAVDWMITIVEPGFRSLRTAQRIKTLAHQIGIKRVVAIANKTKSLQDKEFILKYLDKIPLLGDISFSDFIAKLDRKEGLDFPPEFTKEFNSIITYLEKDIL